MTLPPGFFTVHHDMPREGPGEPADVAWAARVAGTPKDARILDVACGPGGDIAALRDAAPKGTITAIDGHGPFIETLTSRFPDAPWLTARKGSMLEVEGPYDLIWCAGAVYFKGIETSLSTWRLALAPGGAVAFSEPCYFTDTPSSAARAFWSGYDAPTADGIAASIRAAGYEPLDSKRVSDDAWRAYYDPLLARSDALEGDPDLAKAIAETRKEAADWEALREETGYLLTVARPR
ncbi:MAG: class I SAM-dependent methyltransferase [Pseudomonadota bacterium]